MIKSFLNLPIWVRYGSILSMFLSMFLAYAYFGPNMDPASLVLPTVILACMMPLCLYPELVIVLARYFHSRNENEVVLIICDHALDLMPGNYRVLLEKHYALMAMKRYAEAKSYSDRAAEIAPKFWLTWYGSALAALWLEDYESATNNVEKALELSRSHSFAVIVRASIREQEGDDQGCLDDCARIGPKDPGAAQARMLSSRVHIALGNYQAAQAIITKVPKRSKVDFDDSETLAYLKFSQNQFTEVLTICSQVLDVEPKYWFLDMQASSYRRLNEGVLALESISRAIAISPELTDGYEERALVLADAGMLDQALIACKRSAVLGNQKTSRTAEAYVHFRRGEFEEMLECTQLAVTRFPKSAYAHSLHSLALVGLARLDEAMAEAITATELHSLEARAWYALANVHLKQDQLDQAIKSLDIGLAADPHYRFLYQLRAEAHRRSGHEVEAERDHSKFDQLQTQFMAGLP